jgi:hypothetical protein
MTAPGGERGPGKQGGMMTEQHFVVMKVSTLRFKAPDMGHAKKHWKAIPYTSVETDYSIVCEDTGEEDMLAPPGIE